MRKLSLYTSIVTLLISIGCASSQQQGQQEDQLEASNQESEQGSEDQAEGEGENFQAQAENGEGINNAEDEEFVQQNSGQEFEGQQLNNAELDTDQADQLVNNGAINPVSTGQSANEIPAEPLDPAAMPAAPVATAPSGSGMVKYAPGPVEIFDQPNGKMIGQFQTGDHPLVYEDNGWNRTADGRFVNQNALSIKGIGRPRDPGIWQ